MSAQAESLHSLLKKLEGLLKEYSPVMDTRTEGLVERAIKYGSVFSEVSLPSWKPAIIDTLQLNPVARAVFGLASVTFEVCARYWRIRSGDNARPLSS